MFDYKVRECDVTVYASNFVNSLGRRYGVCLERAFFYWGPRLAYPMTTMA